MLGELDRVGAKALVPSGSVLAPPAFEVHDQGRPARFLQSIIPTVGMDGDTYAYLRQTARTNNAAAVAVGAKKPTSVYSIVNRPGFGGGS
jgi:hypothetical protein